MTKDPKILADIQRLHDANKGIEYKKIRWMFNNVTEHACKWKAGKKGNPSTARCVDCGHEWQTGVKPRVCPSCGCKLTVYDNRKSVFEDKNIYADFIETYDDYTVVRVVYAKKIAYANPSKAYPQYASEQLRQSIREMQDEWGEGVKRFEWEEVMQHWYSPEGKHAVMSYNLHFMPEYMYNPFRCEGEMTIRKRLSEYHTIPPHGVYPLVKVNRILKRNGIKTSVRGHEPSSLFEKLLSNPRYETMWKLRRDDILNTNYYVQSTLMERYWKQLLMYINTGRRFNDKELSSWVDYLRLCVQMGKDILNRKIALPDNPITAERELQAAMERRRAKIEAKKRLEQDRQTLSQYIKEYDKPYRKQKQIYFDIILKNEHFEISPLMNIQEFFDDGMSLHHCIYHNMYWKRKDSLCLRIRHAGSPDKTYANAEVDLTTGKVLQCYKAWDQEPDEYKEIVSLIEQNPVWKKNKKRNVIKTQTPVFN